MAKIAAPIERTPATLDGVVASALAAGATLYGLPVRRVWVETEDGEWRKLGLPGPAERADDDGLTPTQKRALAALRSSPRPLTRKSLALKLRRSPKGRFGADVRHLLNGGLIWEDDGLLTDDRRKFAASD